MCIAIVKKIGTNLPSDDILRICFRNNPDGAGFAYCRNNKIFVRKGFFTFEGFLKSLKKANIDNNESALIHFRVATHGKINIDNCHPFPIINKFSNMVMPFFTTNCDVMVHNGKLNINISNSSYSDSMHLAKSLFEFDRIHNTNFINDIIAPTDSNKRGNRLGILTAKGDVEIYGEGWIDENGILYSNDSYKEDSEYKKSIKKKKKHKESCAICGNSNGDLFDAVKYNQIKKICFDCAIRYGFKRCNKCNMFFYTFETNTNKCSNCLAKENNKQYTTKHINHFNFDLFDN